METMSLNLRQQKRKGQKQNNYSRQLKDSLARFSQRVCYIYFLQENTVKGCEYGNNRPKLTTAKMQRTKAERLFSQTL